MSGTGLKDLPNKMSGTGFTGLKDLLNKYAAPKVLMLLHQIYNTENINDPENLVNQKISYITIQTIATNQNADI